MDAQGKNDLPSAETPGTESVQRYRVTVAYDGTSYFGWQRQPSLPSVQQALEDALRPFFRNRREADSADAPEANAAASLPPPAEVVGSGRTDAGVHARAQVAHFDLDRPIPPLSVQRALNSTLPPDIRILDAAFAPPDFHAQFSAHRKEYRYFVWNGEVLPPERRLYAAHIRNPLDLEAMREAAGRFLGEHDFAAFTANPHRNVRTTVRTILGLDILADDPEDGGGRLVEFRVRGNGFLYKMVRSIAGFLLAVGLGRERPEAVDEVLRSSVRTARVESAPPQGLFLWQVWYE